jgi:hypothetical protein
MTITVACPFCGFEKALEETNIPKGARWVTCPRCRQRSAFSRDEKISEALFETQSGIGNAVSSRAPSLWENREILGFAMAFASTVKAVLFSPVRFFRNLAFDPGPREPFAFGLLTGGLGSMAGLFWQMVLAGGAGMVFGVPFAERITTFGFFLLALAFIPVYVSARIFIWSAILHICLMLVRAAGSGFGATLRVVAFSQSPQLVAIVPFLGGWIGLLWSAVIHVIGLKEIHGISYLRTLMGLFIFFLFLLFMTIALAINAIFGIIGGVF